MVHPLTSLIGPLRYACQRDFARLSTVKDLRGPLEGAIAAAGQGGVTPAVLDALRAEVPQVDAAEPERRKASLRRVLAALAASGVELPTELSGPELKPAAVGQPAAVVAQPVAITAGQRPSSAALQPAAAAGRPVAMVAEQPPAPFVPVAWAGRPQGTLPLAPRQPRPEAASAPPGGGSAPKPPARGSASAPLGGGAASKPPARGSASAPLGGDSAFTLAARSPAPAPPARGPAAATAPSPSEDDTEPPELGADDDDAASEEPAAAPSKKRKGRRNSAAAAEASRSEARLLSIAPREGPLATPLGQIGWRINPRLLGTLNKKGVRKAGDVLFLLPRVYEDRRRIHTIAELIPGERGVTVGVVKLAGEHRFHGGRRAFRAVIADATGSIAAVFWRTGPWLAARFPLGKRLVVSGEVRASPSGREIAHPEIEPADDLESSKIHFNRFVPVYPGFERHEQRSFRELAFKIADRYAGHLEEPLPADLRARQGLLDLPDALRRIHFPSESEDLDLLDRHLSPAHRRLAFDELFFLQLGMSLKRQGVKVHPGIAFDVSEARLAKAKAALPFALTGAQTRVIEQLRHDLGRPEPMSRLLQGDVGSGKTAVALVAAALALQDGYQVAVMAPTEILAEQHERTFTRLLEPLGYKVGLVSSGGAAKKKRDVRDALRRGELHLAVGTHALIQESVEFQRLGLVVIDEQHRFGVIQRHALMRMGRRPDVLVMTATPIPRTLAMTLYGDLDVSVIDELPPGRTPILTKVFGEKQRPKVYAAMTEQLERGHQCYVVFPLVEESEKVDLADATQGAEKLREVFPKYAVGLLHGRMKHEEKEAVMAAFRARTLQILVCTTVVEVGVDVPNASVMVIEAAERFGLSQLHQLRGRVGRGAAKSFCYLLAGYAQSKEAADRLAVMEESADGFVIAERDLDLRGPGEFLGTRQSGMPELAVANLSRDAALLSLAQEEARRIVEADPRLERPEHRPLIRALQERWEGRLALAEVG